MRDRFAISAHRHSNRRASRQRRKPDAAAFRVWARLMHRRSDELIEDAMIAATAIVHDLVVVTRNVRDFKPLGVKTLDPFTPPRGRR